MSIVFEEIEKSEMEYLKQHVLINVEGGKPSMLSHRRPRCPSREKVSTLRHRRWPNSEPEDRAAITEENQKA